MGPLESLILVLPPAWEHEFYKIDVFHFIGKFGPKIGGFEGPKSMQNRRKLMKKTHLKTNAFLASIFFDFPWILAPKLRSKKSDFFKLTAPELSALSILDLSPPVSIQELKDKYKELVKLYHPDTNGGSKSAEEKLKSINRAYETLIRLTNS